MVRSHPRQIVPKTLSQKIHHKNRAGVQGRALGVIGVDET
jgi:hypothetical protein